MSTAAMRTASGSVQKVTLVDETTAGDPWGQRDNVTIRASSGLTATANGADITTPGPAKGVLLTLDITAVSGTSPTLDVKLQTKDPVSGKYVDMANTAAFAQKSATGTDTLIVYPGVTATANRSVSMALPKTWRLVYTVGGTTPSFTFSVGASYIP